MLKKHCFVFDSSIGIGSEKYPNVFVVPLIINQKNKDYVETLRDGVDISISKISSLQVAGVNFSTSAANPSDVMALFDHLVKEYENIWVFPIPKLLSETGNNVFRLIASEYQNIKVIDSYTVALMSEWQAQDLIALNNAKKVTEENILAIVNHYKEKIGAPLIVPDLSFLVKGGRISRTKGFIGKLLKIIAVASFDREGVSFRDKTFDINELPKICDKYYETIINNID
jgi:DegV family protein with EDD domain